MGGPEDRWTGVDPSWNAWSSPPVRPPKRPSYAIVLAVLTLTGIVVVGAVVYLRFSRVGSAADTLVAEPLLDVGGRCPDLDQLTSRSLPDAVDLNQRNYDFEITPPSDSTRPMSHDQMDDVDAMMGFINTVDPDGRRAELERDGFTGGSRSQIALSTGGSATVLVLRFRDGTAATSYARFHIRANCSSSDGMRIVPGTAHLVAFGQQTNTHHEGRAVMVVGPYEVNLTSNYAAPDARAAAEKWAMRVDGALPVR